MTATPPTTSRRRTRISRLPTSTTIASAQTLGLQPAFIRARSRPHSPLIAFSSSPHGSRSDTASGEISGLDALVQIAAMPILLAIGGSLTAVIFFVGA